MNSRFSDDRRMGLGMMAAYVSSAMRVEFMVAVSRQAQVYNSAL